MLNELMKLLQGGGGAQGGAQGPMLLQALASMAGGGGQPQAQMPPQAMPQAQAMPQQMPMPQQGMDEAGMINDLRMRGPNAGHEQQYENGRPVPEDAFINPELLDQQHRPNPDQEMIDYISKRIGSSEIEGDEYEWEGTPEDGPTKNDLAYMRETPTDGVLEDFEKYFGITPNVNEPKTDEGEGEIED